MSDQPKGGWDTTRLSTDTEYCPGCGEVAPGTLLHWAPDFYDDDSEGDDGSAWLCTSCFHDFYPKGIHG